MTGKKLLFLLLFIPIVFSCSKEDRNLPAIYLQIGDMYAGGIVFQVNGSGTSGLVARTGDSGAMNHYEAMDLESNGWSVPSISQLGTMYNSIGQGADNIGNFADGSYWSSTSVGPSNNLSASKFNFANGTSSSGWNPVLNFRVRLISSF
tara:strand:+ start:1045 stop:1491 length:447 start_codon:yes stop_codon:yes gene_type:complete